MNRSFFTLFTFIEENLWLINSCCLLLLMFVLHDDNICAIPRSGRAEHVRQNAEAASLKLIDEDYRRISDAFPAPDHKTYLDIV